MNKCALLVVCGLFLACNQPQAKTINENPVKIELASLIERGPAETISLNNWSKSIKFVPLETEKLQPLKVYPKLYRKMTSY